MANSSATSGSSTPYTDAILACLPAGTSTDTDSPTSELSNRLQILLSSSDETDRALIENVLRFALGGPPPAYFLNELVWSQGQQKLDSLIGMLEGAAVRSSSSSSHLHNTSDTSTLLGKRPHPDDTDVTPANSNNKKPKPSTATNTSPIDSTESTPLFTLHSTSLSSPIRKKAHISITRTHIIIYNPNPSSSSNIEAAIPLTDLKRAFLVPTQSKSNNKKRWSVILLCSDIPERNKTATANSNSNTNTNATDTSPTNANTQIVFTLDALSTGGKDLFTTSTTSLSSPTAHPKGTETYPHLFTLLSHLPSHIPLLQTPISLTAYRSAKEGALFLFESTSSNKANVPGILWAESKPCEFFAVEDLAGDEEQSGIGVRTLSATGRTFSLFVRRKATEIRIQGKKGKEAEDEGEDEEEEILEGEETEFAMIDGREQDKILQWVRKHQSRFGKDKVDLKPKGDNTGNSDKATITAVANSAKGAANQDPEDEGDNVDANSDEEDDDFEVDSGSDGGSATSDSSDAEGGDANGDGDGDGGDEEDEDAEGDDDEDEDEDAQLGNSILRQPGMVPRMSKAAIDAVIGIVEGDLGMRGTGSRDEVEEEEEDAEGDGEDELEEADELDE